MRAEEKEKIENVLEELNVKYSIKDSEALIEFWTDTSGQDIPTEFDYDGSIENFVEEFARCVENYDVDEEVELFVGMRGQQGVPDTVRELIDDCQEAKDTLMLIAERLKEALSGEKYRTIGVTAYPYAVQYGKIRVPEDVALGSEEEIKNYIRDNFNDIVFESPELDYAGTDFDIE